MNEMHVHVCPLVFVCMAAVWPHQASEGTKRMYFKLECFGKFNIFALLLYFLKNLDVKGNKCGANIMFSSAGMSKSDSVSSSHRLSDGFQLLESDQFSWPMLC